MPAHHRICPAKPRLASPEDAALTEADARLRLARVQFSIAATACLCGSPDAPAQVRSALDLIEQARAEVRRLIETE